VDHTDTASLLTLAVAGLGCLATGLYWRGRGTANGRALERHRQDAVALDRMLGLLGQDIQARGLALLGLATDPPADVARAVEAEARSILSLADDLAEWRAIRTGPRTLRTEALVVKPLVEDAVAAVAALLSPGRRQWRIAEDLGELVVHADRRALRGALVQVLMRAVRLTRDGDWINLRSVLSGETVSLVVEDDGRGLGAEDLAQARPGVASSEGRTRGLDFGLAIARALLEAHGGELRLEALRNVGARAWLILPRERLLAGA
jgi:signal transduction histidine kinase